MSLAGMVVLIMAGCSGKFDDPKDRSVDSSATDKLVPQSSSEAVPSRPEGLLPTFRMISAESGLDFQRYEDIRGNWRLLEVNGGGVAMFDFDRDNWLDLFFTNGCRLPVDRSDQQTPCGLFRNQTAMQFERVRQGAQLRQFGQTHGCAVGDFDADGFDDLYVAAFGRNTLWQNNGDGTFRDITVAAGAEVPVWSSSAAFSDVNTDGRLDLYVVNYVDENDHDPRLCPNPKSPTGYVSCPPSIYEGLDDALLLGTGTEKMFDATAACGVAGRFGKGLSVVIADLGGDPQPEIYVANDGQENFLFVNARSDETDPVRDQGVTSTDPSAALNQPQFEERALMSGTALSESGFAQASMGIAIGDIDANGTLDLFLTNFLNDTNTVYANQDRLSLSDVTRTTGLGPASRQMLGWGTVFFDVDNNQTLDLFVTNGHVHDLSQMEPSEPYHMGPQLFLNRRPGEFDDVSQWSGPFFEQEWLGRGAACGDLDRDGRVDLAVSHQLQPSFALRNETHTDHQGLVLRFVGTQSNRNGYGVRVEVVNQSRTVMRELTGGGSFQSASAPEIHLGLGNSSEVTIRVRWPSGQTQICEGLRSGTWVVIEGGDAWQLPDDMDHGVSSAIDDRQVPS